MANPDNDETPAVEAPPAPKKGRSKLLVIGIPVFILLMGGGAGAWWYFNQPVPEGEAAAAAADAAHAEEDEEAGLLELEAFIVNLADAGGRKYLRVKLTLLLADEATAKEVEENKLTISRLRSAIIEVLAVKTSTDLATPEGRVALRGEIAEAGKTASRHLEVKDVLFEDFIVQ